ncbi:MAG: hypothetical protein K6G70_06470 [Bacteroidaceae bacterium]|nr:hypothetical protein [Bacteroidaceae bacterium]
MEKKLLAMMTIVLMALVCTTFISCGDDDDDKTVKSPIVGTWVLSESGSDWSSTETIVFNSNGTGTLSLQGYATANKKRESYSYSQGFTYNILSERLLQVHFEVGQLYEKASDRIWAYSVSGNQLTINDGYDVGKDYSETYTKR